MGWFTSWLIRRALVSGARSVHSVLIAQAQEDVSRVFRDAFCYNQGRLVEYSLMISKYHQDMRLSYEAYLKGELDNREKELAELRAAHNNLCEYIINNYYNDILYRNFDYAKQAFSIQKGVGNVPRMCAKHIVYEDGQQFVETIARDSVMPYDEDEHHLHGISQNSASLYAKVLGKYYIENNIPQKSKKINGYINPRLNAQSVQLYEGTGFLDEYRVVNQGRRVDEAWVKCWNPLITNDGQALDPPQESCYKSTLVVPMTLANNNQSIDFLKHIYDKFKESNSIEFEGEEDDFIKIKKQIYGFFCMDHVSENYFNNSYDLDIGYFFADLICVYQCLTLNYLALSRTTNHVEEILAVASMDDE
ncbi:MAG: hypothetical protein AB1916_06675 [Thermodesulfobacteriota bacterium]